MVYRMVFDMAIMRSRSMLKPLSVGLLQWMTVTMRTPILGTLPLVTLGIHQRDLRSSALHWRAACAATLMTYGRPGINLLEWSIHLGPAESSEHVSGICITTNSQKAIFAELQCLHLPGSTG